MAHKFEETLQTLLDDGLIKWERPMLQQCALHYALLVQENQKYNLTTITKPEEAAEKHFFDALSLLPALDDCKGALVIDVGSGAGFPGLPLKIFRPALQMTLLDAAAKKTAFLEQVIQALGLEAVWTSHGRAEEQAARQRESYDAVLSRAVAELRVLAELTLPLVKVGGKVILSKGPGGREEIAGAATALKVLGGEVERVREFTLPLSGARRSIVIIAKKTVTPAKYPRRPGMPKKKPL